MNDNKLEEIQLVHEAGAGGTTLARRIAFDLSLDYPCVLIHKYLSKKTIDGLRILYDQYTKGTLPLLIVIESFEVRDSQLLFRDLSNSKKNAVLIIVHRGSIQAALQKKFTLKSQLEGMEINAFENAYLQLVPSAKERIREIPKSYKNEVKYISPVLYALTAFGKDYNGLESYVLKCLESTTTEQKKLAGFICLVYYYTQKSVSIEIFSSIFGIDRSSLDLEKILGHENPLFDLLHQEANDEEYFNVWRPRYALLGDEAMAIILSGGAVHKLNWKNYLATWLVELIERVRETLPYLDEATLQLFGSLFIERDYFDESFRDKEFTHAINDLPNPADGVIIFDALTHAYPDEAHFHGHFARYLYSAKIGIKNYKRAIEEAEMSLEISPRNSSLIHTLGMCYREQSESLMQTYDKQGLSAEEAEGEVKALTEDACDKFDECIEADPNNIYGYESQIRILLRTLDFGFKVHQASSKESFITDPSKIWYAEKLDKVSNLLEECLYVIEQAKKLENRERIQKSAGYVYDCEGIFFRTLGRHLSAKSKFEDLVKNTPKGNEYMRPHYRRMFVMCLLASKSAEGQRLFESWDKISVHELDQCVKYLDENIFEDPGNTQNIRLWLQAIRHLKSPPGLELVIAKIATWTQIAAQNENSLLEGYYYLYALNSIKAIGEGDSFDPTAIQTVKKIIEKMRPFVKNEKFCFEWYGKGNGVNQMLSHRKLGEYSSNFFERNKNLLCEVEGRIKEIVSSQQGSIVLRCGLEAFFVPNIGGFTERSIHDRVKFYIGFRYDQIQAWSVIPYNRTRESANESSTAIELKPFIEDTDTDSAEVGEVLGVGKEPAIENSTSRVSAESTVSGSNAEVGRIYEGRVKLYKGNLGFIGVDGLVKDVAFKKEHLKSGSAEKLKQDLRIKVRILFIRGRAATDSSGRNYLAEEIFLI